MRDTEKEKIYHISSAEELKQNFTKEGIKQYYIKYYPTREFKPLDELLGGGLYYGLTVLGAIPALGKSTLALQMAYNIAAAGKNAPPVLYISLEMPRERLLSKIIGSRIFATLKKEEEEKSSAPIDYKEIARRSVKAADIMSKDKLSDSQWELVERVNKSLDLSNLYLIERSEEKFTVKDVTNLIENYTKYLNKDENGESYRTPVVFLDYLQILSPMKDGGTDKQVIDENISILNTYANTHKIPIFIISSFSRTSYGKSDVSLNSFKESGSIEFTSSCLFGMRHTNTEASMNEENKKFPRELTLVCLKQRYGQTGDIKLYFYPSVDYFECVPENKAFGGTTTTPPPKPKLTPAKKLEKDLAELNKLSKTEGLSEKQLENRKKKKKAKERELLESLDLSLSEKDIKKLMDAK